MPSVPSPNITIAISVDANENGVVLRLGKYSHTTMPGLHPKFPFIDRVYTVKVDYQYKMEFGFRTLKAGVRTEYSNRNFNQESWMLTGDLNIAEVHWIVQYKIKDAADYLFNVRDVENTIKDVSPNNVLVTHGREEGLLSYLMDNNIKCNALNLVGFEDEDD